MEASVQQKLVILTLVGQCGDPEQLQEAALSVSRSPASGPDGCDGERDPQGKT